MLRYMMRSISRQLLLISMLVSPVLSAGQEGIPYITYYDSRTGFESQNWSVCQDSGSSMFFANKQGVTVFDGLDWHTIKLPHVPLEIATATANGGIYVLSDRNYGMLKRTNNGKITYEPMTYEGELDRSLKKIYFSDTSVIFYGTNHISFHSYVDQTLQRRITSGDQGAFTGMMMHNGKIFINTLESGLLHVSGDSLVPLPTVKITANHEILFWLPYDNQNTLIGLDNTTLMLFDGNDFKEYPLSEASYLESYGLSDGIILNDSLYVFSTYYGGAVIVERESGKVRTILNYENGLADDEVYAMGKDHAGGIWLTYRYGICRVDPLLPVREYTTYPGLEGLLTNTEWYNNTLYVATTEGLFFLEEVKDYSETQILVKQEPMVRQPGVPGISSRHDAAGTSPGTGTRPAEPSERQPEVLSSDTRADADQETAEQPAAVKEEKRGFFDRLFNRETRTREPESTDIQSPGPAGNIEQPKVDDVLKSFEIESRQEPQQPRYIEKTVRKLKAVRYVYRKVKGINSGCMQLLPTNSSLLTGSSSGLYAVNDSIGIRLSDSRNISAIHKFDNEKFYVVSEDGLEVLHLKDNGWLREKNSDLIKEPLFSVTHDPHFIWLSGYNKVHRLSHAPKLINTYTFASPYPEELHLKYLRDTLFLFSGNSVSFYAATLDTFLQYDYSFLPQQYTSISFIPSTGAHQWLKLDNQLFVFDSDTSTLNAYKTYFELFRNITAINQDPESGYWIIDDNEHLFKLSESISNYSYGSFNVNIEYFRDASGKFIDLTDLTLQPEQTIPLQIRLSAPFFPGNEQTRFQYRIENLSEGWSEWSASPELTLFLESGEYTIQVRAKNVLGGISQVKTLFITIKTPFYQMPWFYLSLSPILVVLLYIFFYLRERKIKRDRAILEERVEERTLEISEQKKQIELQKDAITDSITYASRIQKAILPSPMLFEAAFGDYFIYFRPRDIVSGDFYWITERDDQVIFSVADCTGHGVPGAFMSMLGNSFLNEITKVKKKTLTASGILNQLRVMITAALSQSGSSNNTDDGMDIAMCIYNRRTGELNYSGANNPLYLVRDEELHIIKPNRMPIGYFPVKKDFTGHTIKIKKGDVIYLFTDGYTDQFGGKQDKKFTTGRFRKMLLKNADLPMIDQKELLESTFESWKDGTIQIDDVLVMGIRF